MTIIASNHIAPEAGVSFLTECFKFINLGWQHCIREPIPDQGFEQRFREKCIMQLKDWTISQEREMHLGSGLDTASGVLHEVDIVAQHANTYAIIEMKNRQSFPPEKNDVIVFFAKIIDYVALNPQLALKEIYPIFMSNTAFETSGLAACLGLGIHPIAPKLRPLPMLDNNAKMMEAELNKGLIISPILREQFEDYRAQVRQLSSVLSETWFTNRCGYQSESTIVVRAIASLHTTVLSQDLSQLNADCTQLLEQFREAKQEVS